MWWIRLAAVVVWIAILPGVARAAEEAPKIEPCTERCFVLDRMRLTGSVGGELHFEIEGAVSAVESIAVPLFGPPGEVRVERVSEGGRPAIVGFQEDHYFAILPGTGSVNAPPRRFAVRGSLVMTGDPALVVPGPLNTLEAPLAKGSLVEGERLSGLVKATVHFDRGDRAAPQPEPPMRQLARAIRVGPDVRFEYHLVLRSSADLGVVRLPLKMGERVTTVTGSTGWRAGDDELTLPTAGTNADFTVTGVLPALSRLVPDPASAHEIWLVESDAEHHLTIDGDAKAIDPSASPLQRTMPASRAYLVLPGQHLDVRAEALASLDVLAAVVHAEDRTVIITDQADLVADENISYENNGVDHLRYTPNGRPLFLATDDAPERILHAGGSSAELLLPLRAGTHRIRTQSIDRADLRALGGALEIPMARQPLVASHASLTLGLPERVHPIALLGGDSAWWRFERRDLEAAAAALLVALAAFRGARRRALAVVALFGLWLVAAPVFAALVAAFVVAACVWLLPRLVRSRFVIGAGILATIAACVFLLAAFVTRDAARASLDGDNELSLPRAASEGGMGSSNRARFGVSGDAAHATALAEASNFGMIGLLTSPEATREGVKPVALMLPRAERHVTASRELVTSEQPFRPRLVYVTARGVALLEAIWIAFAAWLAWIHRAAIAGFVARARARVASGAGPTASEG